jgi:hypothetical protein
MDVIFPHCAGLDVHKKTVMACRVTPIPQASRQMASWSCGSLGP